MKNEMKFSDYLIQQADPYWQQATDHAFIRDMVDDKLDKDAFARYLVQDYAFLQAFADLIAHTIAYSQTLEQKHRLSTFLSMITSEENDYFIRAFEALNVDPCHYLDSNLVISPAMQGFHQTIKAAIHSSAAMAYANCLVVITCAESVYYQWGMHYRDKSPKAFYFNEWLTLHNNEAFQAFVAWLKSEIDDFCTYPNEQRQQLVRLFRDTCELEAQFFDECHTPTSD